MQIKQIQLQPRTENEEPLALLEEQINSALKELFAQDVQLGICRHTENHMAETNYSAMIIYSTKRKNRITQIKLFDNLDTTVYGARKGFTERVNEYLKDKQEDIKDIVYINIPVGHGWINEIIIVKHREK